MGKKRENRTGTLGGALTREGEERIEAWAKELLERFLQRRGFDLYEITYRKEPVGWVLRVTVDRIEGGLTVEDTRQLSREIGAILDATPEADRYLPGPYHLEISSPGIFRSLKSRKDYERAWNRRVKLRVEVETGRFIEVVGVLQAILEEGVLMRVGEELKQFSWEQIGGGQLYPELRF